MKTTARSSRLRLVAMLSALAAAHAGVLLTSEVDGPGSAQLRAGATGVAESLVPLVGGLLGRDARPDALLLVAAAALVGAALRLGARLALAYRPAGPAAPADPGRRALLLGAAGGAAVLGSAWMFRGRVRPDDRAPSGPVTALASRATAAAC